MQAPAVERPGASFDVGSCVRKLDVDFEHRNFCATIDLHLRLVRVDADVPAHHSKKLLTQYGHEIRLADDPPLVFEQDLGSLACDRVKLRSRAKLNGNTF
jgi:hypothetical protein